MSHQRTVIREELVSILKAANTGARDRVYGDRASVIFGEAYPLILVYARDESVSPQGITPKPSKRALPIAIEIRTTVTASGSIDTALDDLCKQVEDAIVANPRLNQKVMSSNLLATEFDISAEGDEVLGGARLTYEVVYAD